MKHFECYCTKCHREKNRDEMATETICTECDERGYKLFLLTKKYDGSLTDTRPVKVSDRARQTLKQVLHNK